jgi:hypothetical protein
MILAVLLHRAKKFTLDRPTTIEIAPLGKDVHFGSAANCSGDEVTFVILRAKAFLRIADQPT